MAGSFIFGRGQEYATPEELAKARAMAEALLGPQRAPQNVGEGLTAIGQAIRGRMDLSRVNRAEAAGKSSAAAAFNPILQALSGKSGEFPPAPGGGGSSAKASPDFKGDELAWTEAKPYQKALLNTIAGPESGGRYNVIYGGGKFDDFSKHPGQAVRIQTGPNAGRTSSAAGKYQFLGSTWQDQAGKLGLTDFSPANQDKAAWNLAAETYKTKTGQDLDAVLQSGDPAAIASVGKVLNPVWTSLPGGIEQGTNTDRFVSTYQRALNAGASPAQAQQAAQQTQPVQVASLDPSAGVAQATQVPPMPEEYAKTGLSPEAWAKMNAPTGGQGVAKALAGPSQQAQPAAPQGQQVAQALSPDRLPVMAGGNADAIQPGQGGGLGMQQLLQAAQNPWLDQQQRGLINMLIEQEQQKSDPLRQMQLQKGQIEIDALKNPRISPADQAKIDFDREKFKAEQANSATDDQREAVRLKLEQEKYTADSSLAREKFDWEKDKDRLPEFYDAYVQQEKAAGREPLGILDYVTTSKKAGATTINNGSNTSEFVKKSDEAAAKRMDEIVAAGQTAPQTMADMQQLIDLGTAIGTGQGAQIKAKLGPYAHALGIDISNLGDIQAYEAITSRLAPQMRATGSGASSDRDVSMFLQSLPSLRNLPQGNEIIANTMKSVAQNKINSAEIASKAQRGEISWQDADREIRELPNPYDVFKEFQKQGSKKTTIDGYTIEEVE